jgi:membrane protein required for beta-lactamase induction
MCTEYAMQSLGYGLAALALTAALVLLCTGVRATLHHYLKNLKSMQHAQEHKT